MENLHWNDYIMSLAFLVAGKSIDPHTKCGCVFVDADHSILSCGYNGPPRKMDDSSIPTDRELKRPYYVHAEMNGILTAAKHGIPLANSIMYCTNFPCTDCFRSLINIGVKKVVFGPQKAKIVDQKAIDIVQHMNQNNQIEIVEYSSKKFIDFMVNRAEFVSSNFS